MSAPKVTFALRALQFKDGRDAVQATCQHTTPCPDCPWTRTSVNGWLGGESPEWWLELAHGEGRAECHTRTGAQCAGLAVYRANVAKSPRDPGALRLPADKVNVFGFHTEFLAHHTAPPVIPEE